VGGKNASLGRNDSRTERGWASGFPGGFATTSAAYRYYLESTGLVAKIRDVLTGLDPEHVDRTCNAAAWKFVTRFWKRRCLIELTQCDPDRVPGALPRDWLSSPGGGSQQCDGRGSSRRQFCRSAGDVPERGRRTSASWTPADTCFASLFTDRAISYRTHKGFDHFDVALSVGVQHMVRSDIGAAGVIFHDRYRNGFQQRGLDQCVLRAGRECGEGHREPG
jgi:pyruvate,water dikinase